MRHEPDEVPEAVVVSDLPFRGTVSSSSSMYSVSGLSSSFYSFRDVGGKALGPRWNMECFWTSVPAQTRVTSHAWSIALVIAYRPFVVRHRLLSDFVVEAFLHRYVTQWIS